MVRSHQNHRRTQTRNNWMKIAYALLCLLTAGYGSIALAECPHTFSCDQRGCAKVVDPSCELPVARPPAPPSSAQPAPFLLQRDSNTGLATAASGYQSGITPGPSTFPASTSTYGCAENGSCYGDISNITGAPKTIAVQGYYRSDGTYVRGHYRSRR
jgi:hypothetical protein